jgi:hypothetical protein
MSALISLFARTGTILIQFPNILRDTSNLKELEMNYGKA